MTRYDANDELPRYGWRIPIDAVSGHEDRWIGVSGGDLPCPIEVRLGKPKAGRVICTGLRVGQWDPERMGDVLEYEVSSRLLRDIRLGNVLRALREYIGGVSDDPRFAGWLEANRQAILGVTAAEAINAAVVKNLSVRRGRKGLDPETLKRTAEVYLQAIAEGSTQPLAVAAVRLDVDPSTVWRRLQKAWQLFSEMKPKDGGAS